MVACLTSQAFKGVGVNQVFDQREVMLWVRQTKLGMFVSLIGD